MEYLCEELKSSLFEEDKSQNKPPRVLKIVKGCVADFNPNRNGRIYPEELWDKVINSEYVKEMIGSNSLFGEGDHPSDRNEISLQHISHAIKRLWKQGKEIWAELHILDTPLGQVVNNLIEYGSKIGVSSRGAGEVGDDGVVNSDSYKFFTFDLVCRPSVAAARPAIVESENVEIEQLTEGEINNILDGYRGMCKKSEKNVSNFIYMSEGQKMTFENNIIEDLILEGEDLNSSIKK